MNLDLDSIDHFTFDIDKRRYDKVAKAMLLANEETAFGIPDACRTCAYRNRDINYCWYTMITNKKSNCSVIKCDHYVDIRKVNL